MNRVKKLAYDISAGALFSILVCGPLRSTERGNAPPHAVRIEVDAARRRNYIVPRTIFGTFLEPIGHSINNGLWAEILQNPSFEEDLWDAPRTARMIREEPALARSSELGLPLPWEPLDRSAGNRYEPHWADAANSWCSLEILGLPGVETGIKQKVFLPVHREMRYTGSLFAKHISGPDALYISFRRRNDAKEILRTSTVLASATQWHKYTFALEISTDEVQPLTPLDFVITVEGDERVMLDEASLMPADANDGLDPEMVELAKQLHTPLVRFGGNFTSAYHWRNGVGPRDKRISMRNIAWGIPEYNQFGTDEFLKFCELIGAQPQIALNLGSGTPEEAADWVRYVKERWKKAGLLWELGNELWGDWNVGYPSLQQLPSRTRAFSDAVRRVDPSARLIAAGQDPDAYRTWNAAQLANPPGTFDFLSAHFVVTTTDTVGAHLSQDVIAEDVFALPVELARRLQAMQAQINDTAAFRDRVHIAFTEWLLFCCEDQTANAPRYDNMGGAIFTASFLNMLLMNADVVPIADMTGLIEFGGIWKKRGRVFVTPAYHAFRLYSTSDSYYVLGLENNSAQYNVSGGIKRLPDIVNVPFLDITATLNRTEDKLTIFCVNRHVNKNIPVTISFKGFDPAQSIQIESLYADTLYDTNSEVRRNAIQPIGSTANLEGPQLTYTFRHASVTRIEVGKR